MAMATDDPQTPSSTPFDDPLHARVWTTTQVMAGAAVLHALHDADGRWHFYDHATPDRGDVVTAVLGELLESDPTLGSLAQLPRGRDATRRGRGHAWMTSPMS
jgi:hypothetical protein